MSRKQSRHDRPATGDPGRPFRREDVLRFIELKPFNAAWKALKLGDDDLAALQIAVMLNPAGAPVVAGTGGLRKMRFAPRRWAVGKSAAVRVGYVYLQDHRTVLLVIAYSKDEKDDLTPAEKKTIHTLIRRIESEFAKGLIR